MRHFKSSLTSLALLGLAACGSEQDVALNTPAPTPTPTPMTTVSGVAATGAPINGGAVELHCGNGVTAATTSAANGSWSTSVASAALPCGVKVSGGTPAGTFYSIAQSASGTASTANVTPVSDLALASAVNNTLGTALDAWYASATDAQRQQVAAGIAAAIASLRTALTNAGYTLPASDFNPFTAAIAAGTTTDAYDQLLDAYKQALTGAGKTYEAARSSYTGGGGVQPHMGSTTPPAGPMQSAALTAPSSTSASDFLAHLAGNYNLLVTASSGPNDELPSDSVRAVTIKADGTVNIVGKTKTVVYTYTQKSPSDYTQQRAGTATELDRLSYFTASGTTINFFLDYEPATGHLTLRASGYTDANSDATLESKMHAASTGTGTGTAKNLAGKIGTAYTGTYVVNCTNSDKTTTNHTVVINTDGSSTLDNVVVADATHAGSVRLDGNNKATFNRSGGVSAAHTYYQVGSSRLDGVTSVSFALRFNPDGSIDDGDPNGNVVVTGSAQTFCTAVSGTSHPSLYDHAQASALFAKTQTVNCTAKNLLGRTPSASSPNGSTTFSIGTDGVYTLGSLSMMSSDYNSLPRKGNFLANDSQTFNPTLPIAAALGAGYDTSSDQSAQLSITVGLNTTGVVTSLRYFNGYDFGDCAP